MLFKYTFVTALIIFAAGCANRFGYISMQTVLTVNTVPKFLPYYILDSTEASKYLRNSSKGLEISDKYSFEHFVSKQFGGLISNSGGFSLEMGRYLIYVQCPKKNEFRLIEVNDNKTIEVLCK